MNKKILRQKKFEVLKIHISWEERGADQKHINFENWERLYYMRKLDDQKRESKRRYSNTQLVFLKKHDDKKDLIEHFEQFEIKPLWEAYRNRTKWEYFISSENKTGGVIINGENYYPCDILWIIKYKVYGNKRPNNDRDKTFKKLLIKKI